MKPRLLNTARLSFPLASALAALLAMPSASAQLYWDGNGTTAGAGDTPNGTWGTDAFWNTTAAGDVTTPTGVTTTSLENVFFSAGSDAVNPYAVGLNSATQNARLVTFEDGTVTLDTGTLSLGKDGGITVTANTVTGATISSGLTLSGRQTFNVAASRTLTLGTGTFTRDAGSVLNVLSTGTVTTTMTNLDSVAMVNGIVGPWASHGSGASTKYATFSGNDIVGLTGTAAATAANVTDTGATFNYDVAAVGTLGAGANINTLRYTGAAGTIAGALTTNGIMNTGGGTLTFSGAMTSGTGEMVLHAANGNLKFTGGLNNSGNRVTITGSGQVDFSATASIITGAGGITMNGTGNLLLGQAGTNPVHNYTGTTILNGGQTSLQGGLKSAGNFTLNGAMLTDYFQSTTVFSAGLGTGGNQIQIYGDSGFGAGNGSSTWRIGASLSVLTWGSANFNPTTLKFQTTLDNNGPTIYGYALFDNGLDLGGASRTIDVLTASAPIPVASGGRINGVISNGSLIKTGGGNLTLNSTANTYAGTTTITAGILTVGGTGSLGDGSATNTLFFNGGTLRATGTVTSPLARGVTMTATGIFDNNGQAISIAGNIGGAGGLTKNSTGTLTLSGTNTYGGVTTANAGTLQFTNEVSLASNTAANLNVKSGATLALNVGGAGQFTAATINSLLSNISVANTAAQGLQAGAILGLDTTGGTFTQGNAIANSTGAFGGTINLTKLGAGTLILDKTNTYTGLTTISGGTLQLDAGGVIATSIFNNATFAINSAGAVTQGTNFGLISGNGAVTNAGAGTLTLNLANTYTGSTTVSNGTIAITNALAMQNSAYNTAGSNGTTIGLNVTSGLSSGTLTLGGLVGSVDLASAFTAGFTGSVTNLILNPQSGVTVTYGGVISDGSGAMSLTKTGAGTQILTGANTYSGATIVNAGTLTIGVNGSLNSSSALQINGATFSYGNTAAGLTLNGLTVGAGNSTVSNTAAAQTLTLGAITRTASVFGTVNFATLTGPISTTTGNVNSIIGPWATTGTGTSLRYAGGSPDGSTPTNISTFTGGTTATAGTLANVTDASGNFEYSAATATATDLTANTLRYSGVAATTAIGATNTLTLNGLMQAGTGLLTISGGPTTGGILIGSTGELVIAANTLGTTISAAIGGTGRLVYSGAGSRLLLSSTTSNYSGGTVINSGQLAIASDAALGNPSGSITLNGGAILGNSTNPQVGNAGGVNITSARSVIVGAAGGSIGAHGNNTFATTGPLSGTGTLTFLELGGGGGRALNFNSTSNTFIGRLVIFSAGNTLSVNSLVDTAGSGNIALTFGALNNGSAFAYGAGAASPLTLNNRAIELNASGAFTGTILNNNTTHALTINTDLVATGAGSKTLTFGGVAGPANVFSGKITNGTGGGTTGVTASGAGNWTLSGNNTYTGQTTVAGSTGATLTLSGDNSGMSGNVVLSTATATVASSPRLNINSATALGTGILNFGGGLATDVVRIDNTSAGAVNVSTANPITMNRNFTFVGTQDLSLGTGITTLGGMTSGSSRSITVTANTLTLNGTIAEAASNLGITKAGAGTLLLNGTNTYTGDTNVNAGTLGGTGTIAGNVIVAAAGSLAPGASAGTLSIAGGLTVTAMASGTGKLKFELGANTATSDQIAVAGALTSGGALGFSDFTFTYLPGGPQNGTYILITTGADPTSALDGSNLSGTIGVGGTGVLSVSGNNIVMTVSDLGAGSPFTTWSGAADFETDTNNDGVNNGLAWILGAADKNVSAIGLLPELDNTTDPDYFIFTYRRKDDASTDPNTTITAEYSTTLGSWTTAVDNADIDIIVTDNHYSVTPGVDRVQVKLKRSTLAPGGRLFTRLKGTQP